MNIKCFYLEPTDTMRVWLRRYRSADPETKPCPLPEKYHQAMTLIGDRAEKKDADGYVESISQEVYADDPRWPVKCECGYEFGPLAPDEFQVFSRSLYRRTDTGEIMTLEDAPAGAIWNAWWQFNRQTDGQSLNCICPGGHHWNIDGRAGNCDSPCVNCGQPYHAHTWANKGQNEGPNQCKNYQDARPHQCWIRHGTPPKLTVDKNGVTCGAGAGSILAPGWHGFLTDGELRDA